MKYTSRELRLAIGLAGFLLLLGPTESNAGITINSASTGVKDKTAGGTPKGSGLADAKLSLDFVASATTDLENPALTYTWDFGDGTTATGATVSHTFGVSKGGERTVVLTVSDTANNSATESFSISVFTGIRLVDVGDNARLCFDAVRNVEGRALPDTNANGGVALTSSVADLIDWYLLVCKGESVLVNDDSGTLSPLTEFSATNSSWGANVLFVSIDGTSIEGQDGELNLTGTASFIGFNQDVHVFFDLRGDQNSGNSPNWYYYWSQTSAQSGTNTYGRQTQCQWWIVPDYPCTIGDSALTTTGESTGPYGANANQVLRYIDFFAFATRHEWQHHSQKVSWWGANGFDPNTDTDEDHIPDSVEINLPPINLVPYNLQNANTFGQTYDDNEVACLTTQEEWDIGSAEGEDWAYPGSQWEP